MILVLGFLYSIGAAVAIGVLAAIGHSIYIGWTRPMHVTEPAHNPKLFEAQIAHLFRSNGYRVKQTPYQGDHGIDLKVYKPDEYAIVQCKRYTGAVGEPIVRDFYGCMVHEGADVGFIVTTSHFTEQAYKWAMGKRIVMIDGKNLRELLIEVQTRRMKGNFESI